MEDEDDYNQKVLNNPTSRIFIFYMTLIIS